MKKLFIYLSITIALHGILNAQTTSEMLAEKISKKMKDTLSLSKAQTAQIYAINLRLSTQKALARKYYAGTDSAGYYIQRIERTRDSLYHTVITNEEKYNLYKKKKRNLVSNN